MTPTTRISRGRETTCSRDLVRWMDARLMSMFGSSVVSLGDPATVEDAIEDVLVSVSGSSCADDAIMFGRPGSQDVVFQSGSG